MSLDKEEVIGVHHSGIKLVEGANSNLSKFYCANCKRKIHCFVTVNKGEGIFHNTCRNENCECRCKTHYECKICGYLHGHGRLCNRKEQVRIAAKEYTDTDKLLDSWRESHSEQVDK